LGNTIHLRMTDVLDRKTAQMWKPEESMLQELRDVTTRVASLRQIGNTAPTGAALNTSARKENNARGMATLMERQILAGTAHIQLSE
jgi:hypothetical protein